MPRLPRGDKKPRFNFIVEEVRLAQFTDGGGAAGTYALAAKLPAGAVVGPPISVQVSEAFIGDTTAVIIVGDGSDTDRYNTGTPSVFTTGHKDMGLVSGAKGHTAETTITLTVTSGSDFGLITAGKLRVVIPYLEPV